ncbi:HlyD family efflux transporter periplasmic adaptor subunit [Photobacterium indicum]|uniref:HlyD family efflux transporter periplasmic adaptor subunit n=1 Tax=Photobacterium indicum TaxID=81447 RepID=UPI003D0BE37C
MTTQTLSNSSKKKRNIILTSFTLIVVVAAGIWFMLLPTTQQQTEDAYVAGQQVMITSQEPGTIDTISVDDTQAVKQGSELLTLNRNKLSLEQQSAEANLKATLRQVQSNYIKIDQLKAQVQAEKIAYKQAKQDYNRRIGGDKDGSVLPEVLAHAKNAVNISAQNLVALNKQLEASEVLLPKEKLLNNPQVEAAISQLRKVYLAQVNSTIIAPKSGMIAKRAVQVGQQIQPGQALMTLVPLNKVWIEANFKETQLTNMQAGQPVTLISDLYGSKRTYTGVVAGIGAGTGSAFSAIPAQNATGNWIKVIQRVPVRIYVDPAQFKTYPLRIGMSMKVTVDTESAANQPFDHSVFTTDESLANITQQHLQTVDQHIDTFVHQITL